MTKLAIILLIGFTTTATANGYSQNNISLNLHNVSLKEALKEIEKQGYYRFVYQPRRLPKDRTININVQSAPLVDVLNTLLNKYALTYRKVNDKLIVILDKDKAGNNEVMSMEITGKITDTRGLPLKGVTIQEKGTNNATASDEDGSFKILVTDDNAMLVVSFVGYKTKEFAVKGNPVLNITMDLGDMELERVVVVGYGTLRKKDLTGSVSSVNLDAMREAPNTNIGQLLQGTVPGLNVGISTTAGGTPPVSVRGLVTLGGNTTVLIIVDGIQYTQSLSSLNPDDIASIDVLKDASATAVYGAQAANGVILITTRRGRNNQKPRIAFTSSFSTQRPTADLRPKTREEYLAGVKEARYRDAYLGPDYTQPNPAFNVALYVDGTMRDASNNLLPNDFNWWEASTGTGKIWENNLSISGGGDRFNYLISGGLVDQSGFIINDKFKRKSIRVNLETKALNWWKIGVLSSGSFVNQDGAEPTLANVIQASPLHVPFDATGKLIPSPTNTLVPNPFQTYYVDDHDRHSYLFANIYSEIDFPFLKGLNYRMNFGNNYRTTNQFRSSTFAASLQGQAFKNYQEYYDYTFDNILTYTKGFGRHDITTTLLYGSIERKYNTTNARAEIFSRLNLSYNSLGQGTNQFVSSGGYNEKLNYQMARVNYKFDDRYLFTVTLRRDGFSGFAENFKYAYFPSMALGWVVSEEKFMSNLAAVDFLKLRAGYGEIGNQTNRYQSIAIVATTPWVPNPPTNDFAFPYVFGDGGTTAAAQQVTALGNPDLKWERSKGLNVGIDFSMLGNRFSGSLDFYRNNSSDLLFRVNIPTITGFESIVTNLGQLRNTGLEAALTYKVFDRKDFTWTTTINFWTNKNRIIHLTGQDLNKDGIEDDLPESGLFIGKSRNAIYDYQINGIYGLNDPLLPASAVGSYRLVDQDKSGTITADKDRIILGRQEPAYQFSWYNSFSYKAFSISFFLNAIQGGKNGYLGNNNPSYFRDDNGIRNNDFVQADYWSPSNPNGKYPRNISGTRAFGEPNNRWQDRSFIRLQDASISYNLASVLKKLKAQAITLYVSGKNLITWTDWDGWDPEPYDANELLVTPTPRNPFVGGLISTGRPVMRAFTVGLNITY